MAEFFIDHLDLIGTADIRVWFTEKVLLTVDLVDPSRYPIAVRFGEASPVAAATVTPGPEPIMYVDIRLTDRLTANAYYRIAIVDLVAFDGTPASTQHDFFFTGPANGQHRKTAEIKRLVPRFLNQRYETFWNAMLFALGESDHDAAGDEVGVSALQQLLDDIFIDTAAGTALTVIGQNMAIPRPKVDKGDDTAFRQLIPLLAWGPKGTLSLLHRVCTVLLGDRAQGAQWDIYEVNPGEVIVEATVSAAAGALPLADATYLHEDATVTEGASYAGDMLATDATVDASALDGNVALVAGPVIPATLFEMLALAKASGVFVRIEQITVY